MKYLMIYLTEVDVLNDENHRLLEIDSISLSKLTAGHDTELRCSIVDIPIGETYCIANLKNAIMMKNFKTCITYNTISEFVSHCHMVKHLIKD